jgi:hypothetical protein
LGIYTDVREIYKRTGSLTKLQKAIWHSSLAISLTYLRGLEVNVLEEEDMPMVSAYFPFWIGSVSGISLFSIV